MSTYTLVLSVAATLSVLNGYLELSDVFFMSIGYFGTMIILEGK